NGNVCDAVYAAINARYQMGACAAPIALSGSSAGIRSAICESIRNPMPVPRTHASKKIPIGSQMNDHGTANWRRKAAGTRAKLERLVFVGCRVVVVIRTPPSYVALRYYCASDAQ